jgi:hypothetical protein
LSLKLGACGGDIHQKWRYYPHYKQKYLHRLWFDFEFDFLPGGDITPNSWVMHDLWDTKKGCIQHFATIPKKLKVTGVKRLAEDALSEYDAAIAASAPSSCIY